MTTTAQRPGQTRSSNSRATSAPRYRPPVREHPPVYWSRSVLAVGSLGAAFAGMHVVLQDASWWLVGTGFAALVIGSATIARYFVRQRWVPPLVSIIVTVFGVTAGFAGDKAFLGLFPTFETAERVNSIVNAGWTSIQEQRVPAQPDAGIVLLLVFAIVGCALFADAAISVVKAPALLSVPLLTLLAIPVMVRPDIADPLWFVLTAALFLVILRLDRRPTSRPVLWLVGTIVILGGLLAPTFLPEVQEDPGPIGGGVQTGINPLINLGDDLRRGDAVVALTYQTNADKGLYLRLATLESFNGRSWTPNTVANDQENTINDFPTPEGLAADVTREQLTVDVQVGDIAGRWLPLPYPTESVDGAVGDWYWERNGLSARSTNSGVRGQKYEATFLDVQPTLAEVSAAVPHTTADLPTLALPADMPSIITDTAQEIAGDLPTTYERAIALQNYFTSAQFTYSEDAPVEGGYDGSGVDIVAKFLEAKSGYCVHFASAMAIMARTLGIPSRVAVGFQPGEHLSAEGVTNYTVSSHDLHAWPELYFDGVGWLRFEPTPGRGELPNYSVPSAIDDPTAPQGGGADPTPTASAGVSGAPQRPDEAGAPNGGSAAASVTASPLPLVLAVLAILAVLAGFAPSVTRVVVRRRRENAIRRGREPAVAAWAELRDTARDYGWAAPDSETPRDFADRLAVVLTSERETIAGLRSDVEESAFAPPGRGVPTVVELRAVRRAIGRTMDRRDRLRAVFLPASLMARFRYDPEG
ncbi:MAG: transglutaminaseTgpA domain-containing protein [Pseudolysinimonas sp.]